MMVVLIVEPRAQEGAGVVSRCARKSDGHTYDKNNVKCFLLKKIILIFNLI